MPARSARILPNPPAFHWTLVLVLELATLGIFGYAWAIVQALWARKIDPTSKAVSLYVIAIVLSLVGVLLEYSDANVRLQVLVEVAGALIATFGAFSVKNSLAGYVREIEKQPVYLSGLMTIILGEVYLQYHMNRVLSFQRQASPAGAR